jgi:hypothetical protein
MQLHTRLRPILEKINFLSRYKNLREKFPYTDESFEDYSKNEVLGILESFGYQIKYDKKENFFGIQESLNGYDFRFNINCKYGVVELIWDIVKEGERLTLGGPWGLIGDLLIGDDCNIKKPAFRNYDDLKEILQDAFSMYEDFKRESISQLG